MTVARFKIGDRVETANYGRVEVAARYRDQNLGWVYTVRVGRNDFLEFVEEGLTPVPAVDLLAELVA